MVSNDNTTAPLRTITAFFDLRGAAEEAVEQLVQIGILREHIMFSGESSGSVPAAPTEEKGFWESLKDMFLPDEDRYAYSEGLRRGGYLVAARVDDASYDQALDILDAEGSVDMKAREDQWRSEGWSGFSGSVASPGSGLAADMAAAPTAPMDAVYKTDQNAWAGFAVAGSSTAPILEHMDVIASDGMKVGTVDHMEGTNQIKLAKNSSPDGQHHYVPVAWVDHVDAHVHLNKSSVETRAGW